MEGKETTTRTITLNAVDILTAINKWLEAEGVRIPDDAIIRVYSNNSTEGEQQLSAIIEHTNTARLPYF